MKKIAALLLMISAVTVFAEIPIEVEITDGNGAVKAEWSPVQLGLMPHDYTQIFTEKTDIYGFSIALFGLKQKSSVISFAPFCLLEKNYFFQTGAFAGTGTNYALSAAPVLNAAELNYGIQAGVINLENSCDKKYKGNRKPSPGLQIGLVNVGGCIQIGALNFNPNGLIPCCPIINFSIK
ncbi:MAG: hypothetical protein IJW05_12895 [Lentisphaeria bacterium]|nr:hypothetical protein [Lentisphaeria bacterium]